MATTPLRSKKRRFRASLFLFPRNFLLDAMAVCRPTRCECMRWRGYNRRRSSSPRPRHFVPIDLVRIGPYVLSNGLIVAPMAGVTDRPFRQLCKRLHAAYAISEMVGADPRLRHTEKSRRRLDHRGE